MKRELDVPKSYLHNINETVEMSKRNDWIEDGLEDEIFFKHDYKSDFSRKIFLFKSRSESKRFS